MVISALGNTAPFSSRTVPLIVPTVVVCACALKNSAPIRTTSTCKLSFFSIRASRNLRSVSKQIGLSELLQSQDVEVLSNSAFRTLLHYRAKGFTPYDKGCQELFRITRWTRSLIQSFVV